MLIEIFGLVSTVLAVGGVLLNNRLNILCFYLWIVSNAIFAVIHSQAGIWSLVLRDVVFIGLCIEGIVRWRKNGKIERAKL